MINSCTGDGLDSFVFARLHVQLLWRETGNLICKSLSFSDRYMIFFITSSMILRHRGSLENYKSPDQRLQLQNIKKINRHFSYSSIFQKLFLVLFFLLNTLIYGTIKKFDRCCFQSLTDLLGEADSCILLLSV